jgi:YidC/Oxa1 family membrane protein insertase
MHAMQELAPKMQEIREKYKDDPEKMNKKIMNLYKENKVNPLGGCFPMLLQMPIFYALFIILRTTIELRGAPFVLWIQDLSMMDPYMVLPGLMALTMLVQQRAQMKDPRQRPMAIIMPIMFFFLFRSFPAGLTLYWTLFNILSIFQTEFIHKKPEKAVA